MARKIIHQLVDDLDDTVLEPGEGETVLFALDGKSYEIDLSADNAGNSARSSSATSRPAAASEADPARRIRAHRA